MHDGARLLPGVLHNGEGDHSTNVRHRENKGKDRMVAKYRDEQTVGSHFDQCEL